MRRPQLSAALMSPDDYNNNRSMNMKHFTGADAARRNENVEAMIEAYWHEDARGTMMRADAEWHRDPANIDFYAVGAGIEIAEEFEVAAAFFDQVDLAVEAEHAAMFAAESQSFDYMLDEFGGIDDMAVFAARGNVVCGWSVA